MTQAVLPTYNRTPFSIESGKGAWVKASDGRTLLDFGAGIAVNSLGHCHPHLVETLKTQAEKLWHTSNLYRIPEGERFAERLCEATFATRWFSPIPVVRHWNVPSRWRANTMQQQAILKSFA